MPITFACGKCAAKFRVDDKMAGKKVRCPKCQTVGEIPNPQTEMLLPDPEPEPEIDYQVKSKDDDDFWSQTAGGPNPFASPAAPAASTAGKKPRSGASAIQRVQIPGMVLLTLAVIRVILEIAVVILVIALGGGIDLLKGGFSTLIGIACMYYTVTGLLSFVRLDDKNAAWTGLILAMLPCGTSLLCVIAIPFAIWGIVLMNDKQIQASFHS